jgi:hypothetical protein
MRLPARCPAGKRVAMHPASPKWQLPAPPVSTVLIRRNKLDSILNTLRFATSSFAGLESDERGCKRLCDVGLFGWDLVMFVFV